MKFEKEIFISKKSYYLGHVIGKFENVNNFIKTSGATENSAIYQGQKNRKTFKIRQSDKFDEFDWNRKGFTDSLDKLSGRSTKKRSENLWKGSNCGSIASQNSNLSTSSNRSTGSNSTVSEKLNFMAHLSISHSLTQSKLHHFEI